MSHYTLVGLASLPSSYAIAMFYLGITQAFSSESFNRVVGDRSAATVTLPRQEAGSS
ncbi:hypothetical protein H6F90_23180 [Trichocoleus sp. FACHB-591]|uniref:hypothetical protein n=1 Tax=Trichocoleus sp. FACHB-591 TaxID=2692872 RepID=UPI001687CB43|nr:hypothetical protein [Trichocoleus sp. FACHB-591]MBD2097978.1 hypothetical protein [Trichocoleus sp. FACHB-591]